MEEFFIRRMFWSEFFFVETKLGVRRNLWFGKSYGLGKNILSVYHFVQEKLLVRKCFWSDTIFDPKKFLVGKKICRQIFLLENLFGWKTMFVWEKN